MNKTYLLAASSAATLAIFVGRATFAAHSATTMPTSRPANSEAVVAAASAFLDALSAEQRAHVQFSFPNDPTATAARFARNGGGGGGRGGGGGGPTSRPQETGRGRFNGPAGGGGPGGGGGFPGFIGEQFGQSVWSNFPVSDVPRPGLQLGSLAPSQRDAAMRLLRAVLSDKGYQKILDVMGSDQALHESGTPYASGADVYTLGLFGAPGVTAPWMIQFGGHHLGLNVVIVGDRGAMTPTMTGAMPALYTAGGKTVRVLAGENDKAFALLDALDASQTKRAILCYEVKDLVLGPGHAGEAIPAEGLKASAMSDGQRAMLMSIVAEWAGIVSDAYAAPRLDEIRAGLDETYFAWSGPTTCEPGRNGSAYYRIQGPKLLIEFSPQGVGGDSTMHVHTVYRDPTNDYGQALTKAAK